MCLEYRKYIHSRQYISFQVFCTNANEFVFCTDIIHASHVAQLPGMPSISSLWQPLTVLAARVRSTIQRTLLVPHWHPSSLNGMMITAEKYPKEVQAQECIVMVLPLLLQRF